MAQKKVCGILQARYMLQDRGALPKEEGQGHT